MATKAIAGRNEMDTREIILEAARELFIEKGYDKVSMREIAKKTGYSATAIYDYFKDKDDLFLSICHDDFGKLAESFVRLAKVPDPVERLRTIGYAYIEFGLKNPNHYRRMFMTKNPTVSDSQAEAMGRGNPEEDAYEFLRTTVAQALHQGAFRKDLKDADLIAQTLWAGVHGVTSLQLAKCEDNWVPWRTMKKRSELMTAAMFEGLLRKEE